MKFLSAVLLFLYSGISLAQPDSYTLNGEVRDITSGLVLPGTQVESHEAGTVAIADSTGRFSLTGLGKGRHHIHVRLVGYRARAMYIDIPVASDSLLVIQMEATPFELHHVLVESSLSRTDYLHETTDIVMIGDDEMDRLRGITLAQSLAVIPGVQQVQIGVGISKPMIRGLMGNRILVSDLGMKQEGQQWGADHGLEIDQFGVERMEIIKGPGSVLFGSDALGGVIHILPPEVPAPGFRGEWQTMLRSNNRFAGTSVMTEGNRKGNFYRLRVTANGYGDYRIPAEEFTYLRRVLPLENGKLRNTAGRELHAALTLGRAGAGGSVKWTISNYHQRAGLFPGIVGIPTTRSVADDGDDRNIDLPSFYINHFKSAVNAVWNRPKGWLQIDGGVQQNIRAEQIIPVREGYAPIPTSSEAYRLDLRSAQLSARWNAHQHGRLHVIPGASVQLLDHRRSGYEFLLPDYVQWQAGAFVLGEYKARDEKAVWSTGLRVDHGQFSSQGYSTAVWSEGEIISGYYQRAPDVNQSFTNVSGAIGTSWFRRKSVNVKVHIGKSFRIPNAAEWTSNGVHHGTFRHEKGDAELRPENGYQLDLVGVYESRSWYVKVSPFVNYFDGYIYLRPSAEFSELNDGGQVYVYTQHNAVFSGGEVFAEVHPAAPLHLDMSVEYVYSYNLETGLALPFTPPLTGRINLEYEWDNENRRIHYIFAGVRQRITSDQNLTDRNEKATEGYFLTDITAGFTWLIFGQETELRLALNNVWNAKYLNHLSVYRQLNLPEQGRNVTLSLKVPFGQKT